MTIDWEGLVVAFESRSKQITHFFDRSSGEVVQCVESLEPARHAELVASAAHVALPKDHGERGRAEMEAFVAEIEDDRAREELTRALAADDPATAFRDALQKHARDEALFFQFKHRRARERAEAWLSANGIEFEKHVEPSRAKRDFPGGAPGGPRPR